MEKRLGKIEKVHFGLGGYHDAMIGYSLPFRVKGGVFVHNGKVFGYKITTQIQNGSIKIV